MNCLLNPIRAFANDVAKTNMLSKYLKGGETP